MTNLPNVRYMFRIQRWQEEKEYLENIPEICEPLIQQYAKIKATKKGFAKQIKKSHTSMLMSNDAALAAQAPHVA
jgi:hypothetical protein